MKNIKIRHIFSFLLIFSMIFISFGLIGCGDNGNNGGGNIDFESQNILVTYFSATGNTKNVAIYIADILNVDTFEIIPTNQYSQSDLDWTNSSSRVNMEHNSTVGSQYHRPTFVGNINNLEDYDTIFIGYPIWWGEAPNIVYTFLETYGNQFSGKTIIPFCTSSSSGVGQSANNLHSYVSSSANWIAGQRFSSGVSRQTVENWINGLSLSKGENK